MATPLFDEASLFSRVIEPGKPFPSRAAAEAIVALDFQPADKTRLRELAELARSGSLGPDDQRAVEVYGRVGSLLAILRAKATKTLSKSKRTRSRKSN